MRPDPAFLWETEAMRETTDRRATTAPPSTGSRSGNAARAPTWVSLRDASESTGIPVETLRKWARRGTVPTYLDDATNHRMVSMEGIMMRASELGRSVSIDVDASLPQQPKAQAGHPVAGDREAGTMIVPIAAWDKMLLQLGNLHEAGQQLAEARERAAKAETEARFLRERLAEMRSERDTPRARPDDNPQPVARPAEQQPVALWRYVYRGWRDRRR